MNIEISVRDLFAHDRGSKHASASVAIRYQRSEATSIPNAYTFQVQFEVTGLDADFWHSENSIDVAEALRRVANQITATIEAEKETLAEKGAPV